MIITFGSLVAAGVPLLIGLTSVIASLGLVAIASQLVPLFVMVGVFAVFATLEFLDLKELGVGLAVAVLIDAS